MTAHGKHEAWHLLLASLGQAKEAIARHAYPEATGVLEAACKMVACDLARDPDVRAIEATKSGRDPVEWMAYLEGRP